MKLVYVDYHSVNPVGDVSWESLYALPCEIVLFERTLDHELIERAGNCELLLTNGVNLPRQVITELAAKNLRYIGVTATGYNSVDLEAATSCGLTVTNIPAYSTRSVAQHTFALLLELTNQVSGHAASVAAGDWYKSADWSYWRWPVTELAGKTIGLVGYGRIASCVAEIAKAFGMRVLYTSTSPRGDSWRTLDDLLAESDVVSLHCPLKPETHGLINEATLRLMKANAILLNTSRGGLIVAEDLAACLNRRGLAGAGIDVLSEEPPTAANPLIGARNCFVTPHLAWASKEARQRLIDISANNVAAFLEGKPINVVC